MTSVARRPPSRSRWCAPGPWSHTSTSPATSIRYPELCRVSDGAGVPVPSKRDSHPAGCPPDPLARRLRGRIIQTRARCAAGSAPLRHGRRRPPLPVESEHELHQTATRIERHVRILIGQRDLIDRGATAGLRDRVEVDRVEQVQEVDRELEALLAMDVEALSRVQVEACEDRPVTKTSCGAQSPRTCWMQSGPFAGAR